MIMLAAPVSRSATDSRGEYAGPTKTKLRFRLDPGGGRPAIYSNVFDGQVAAAQLAGG
jgi:hypothetical protein